MIPVYQTIFSKTNGNCLAAVWASLLEKKIEDVPNFVEEKDYFNSLQSYVKPFGLTYQRYLINGNRSDLKGNKKKEYQSFAEVLPGYGHIDQCYEATVFSPAYFDDERFKSDSNYIPVCHAVIVNKDFKIVHDPNPNYRGIKKYPLADVIGHNGVIGVSLWRIDKERQSFIENNPNKQD